MRPAPILTGGPRPGRGEELAVTGTDVGAQPTNDTARADLRAAEERLDRLSDEFNGAVDDDNLAQQDLEVARLAAAEADAGLVALRHERVLLTDATTMHIRQLHKLGPTIELTSMFSARAAGDASQRTALLRRVQRAASRPTWRAWGQRPRPWRSPKPA